jgi:magnesium chelatase family protein
MPTASLWTRASAGLAAPEVTVEVHLSAGLPAFNVVGLPESTVRESRERVRSALLNSHFDWPDYRITVNLAPADLPKGGGRFDLPIALGLLAASGQLPAAALVGREFYGELALDGRIRPGRGLMAAVREATAAKRVCAVPAANASALALLPGSRVVGAEDLLSLCGTIKTQAPSATAATAIEEPAEEQPDLLDVRGQHAARRGLEIAAAGGHHLLMVGPPGAGKTLLASRLPGILPESTEQELLTRWLIADHVGLPLRHGRPFRNPHHSASAVALVGGGAQPAPGEITLAHGGVLFLDELPEFPRHVLDTLRQPLESGEVMVARAKGRHTYPAHFQLVAAMNPCPCGYLGSEDTACRCTPDAISRYQMRVSGPLLDRIDLHLTLERQRAAQILCADDEAESSAAVRQRVAIARERQLARQGCANSALSAEAVLSICELDGATQRWFQGACDQLQISARGIHRCLRVARTLADMAAEPRVSKPALLEAIGYRPTAVNR